MTKRDQMIEYVINTMQLSRVTITRDDAERIVDKVYAQPTISLRSSHD